MLPQANPASIWSNVQFVDRPRKSCELHALRGGRLDHKRRDMSEQRETTSADMQQAIPGLMGNIASGRAEQDISFWKKSTMLPQAMAVFQGEICSV
jgi:hypothetical protein